MVSKTRLEPIRQKTSEQRSSLSLYVYKSPSLPLLLPALLTSMFLWTGWAPCRAGANCQVTIAGFDHLGPWSVQWPNDAPVDLAKFPFGAQVTAAMPLQGVLEILSDAKNRNLANNPLASRGSINANNIKILKRDDFASFKSIKPADINEEFLGFFSLLTSYCVLAETSNPIEGPKRILPIMPRTDFVAQYNQFVEPKLRDQLVSQHTSLYEIIQKVSGEAPTLAKKVFKWKPEVHLAIPDNWLGKEADLKAGTLEVEKFLNYVQGYDKAANTPLLQMDLVKLMDRTLRHGQIGGLGGKMETILGSAEPAAIFEFRDLDNVLAADLGATLGRYEDRVIVYHKSIVPVVRENEL